MEGLEEMMTICSMCNDSSVDFNEVYISVSFPRSQFLSERTTNPGPEVIKIFSSSAQLRLKFILLINVKMPTIVCGSKISIFLGDFSIYEKYKF